MKGKKPLGIGMKDLLKLVLKDEISQASKQSGGKNRPMDGQDGAAGKKMVEPRQKSAAMDVAPAASDPMATLMAENERLRRRVAELEAGQAHRPDKDERNKDGERLYREAVRYLKDNRPLDAMKRLLVLLHGEPEHIKAWNNLGVAFHDLGLSGEAVSAFRHVLELEPANAAAQDNLQAIEADREISGGKA